MPLRSPKDKISPTFDLILDGGPNQKCGAIVVLRQRPRKRRSTARLRSRQRAYHARKQAQHYRALSDRIFNSYQRSAHKAMKKGQEVACSKVGSSALPFAHVEVTRKTLPLLAEHKDVLAVLPNHRIRLLQPMRVELGELNRSERNAGATWGLQQLGIPEFWSQTGLKGAGITVAVLDTGVHGDHPALGDRLKSFVAIDPLGRRIETRPAFDADIHGTHVSGTIAGGQTPDGTAIGVAPEADLIGAGVLIGNASLRTLLEGIVWAVDKGADILNMSLGLGIFEPLFVEIFEAILDLDVLPVVAIGNENHGNTSSPGNAKNALSVGAVEKMPRNRLDIATFSSGASLIFPDQDLLVNKPDIAAPGAQVFSSVPPTQTADGTQQFGYLDGTSMATPHVAGVAALLMSALPEAPVGDIVEVLKATANHPGGDDLRPDNRWGWGMVQPGEALAMLVS